MRQPNNAMLSFGDIMSILLVCMVLVCILMSAKVAQEHYTDINIETHRKNNNQTESPGANDLFLTITRGKTYVFEGQNIKAAQTVKSHAKAIEKLKDIMPAKLFIRADRQVDFGIVHQVFNATTEIGIPIALAAKLP